MSKKIMKRSLALGALMAFVITGSAMAGEQLSSETIMVVGGTKDGNGLTYDLASDNVTLDSNAENTLIKNATINVTSGQTLNLISNAPGGDWNGVICEDVTITGDGNIVINQKSYSGNGIMSRSNLDDNVNITANSLEINTFDGNGIYAENGDTVTLNVKNITINAAFNGTSTSGIAANAGSTVTITNFDTLDINVVNNSNDPKEGGPAIKAAGGATLKIEGKKVYADSVGRSALHASDSKIEIVADTLEVATKNIDGDGAVRKNATIAADGDNSEIKLIVKDKLVVEAEDKAGITAINMVDSGAKVTLDVAQDATIQVTGDIKAETGTLNGMNLSGEDSFIKGSIQTGSNENAPISLNDGATWEVTEKSTVAVLDGNGGNVEISDVTEEQVTVGNNKATDVKVSASANAKGLTDNDEANLKAIAASVKTSNNEVIASTAAITGGSVYEEISSAVGEDGNLTGSINKVIDSANLNANDMVAVGLMSWRAETNDMNKRMGELRNANGEHGVWVRMVRGEQEYKNVKNQYNQYQIGYDEKLSVDKRWTVGAALSYTDAENSFSNGNGESENKALAIYGSKLNDDGSFVDLIAKYGRIENDFKLYTGMEDADYSTNAYSLSAEFGKRIQQGNGLWIEPQVELTYGKVSAVDYVSSRGVKVAQDSMESIIGRVGFSLGKDIKQGNVYARASYLYDFDGETSATMDGKAKMEQDLGGGWWEVGVGANINLSKSTYIYADVEKTFGGEVDTNWQWNLGVRYSF